MGLPKRVALSGVLINVYALDSKKIVFTGSYSETAKFLNTREEYIAVYVRTKYRFKKKYALRIAKQQ